MEKLQIKIPLILPDVPDEKDHCIQRLIDSLMDKKGIEKIHISDEKDKGISQLCFHYNPDLISIAQVTALAKQSGALLTSKFGHRLFEVSGIRHTRHARQIEHIIQNKQGILEASVTDTGFIRVEFDTGLINEKEILEILSKQKLKTKKEEAEYIHEESHEHIHSGVFGERTELLFSIIAGVLLGIGFVCSFIEEIHPNLSLSFYIGAYFFGGFYLAKEATETLFKGGFEIDFLMLVAAIGAAIIGAWVEGALLLFLFGLGHSLEHYAMDKANQSIAALSGFAPKTALLKKGNSTEEVRIEKLQIGEVILVLPNTKIAADGLLIKGRGTFNQAPITGESMPVEKSPMKGADSLLLIDQNLEEENKVFAGTINGNNLLEVKVLKLAKDSTLSRLVKLVNEAQTQKSPTQLFTDRFEKHFVPAVLILVLILNFAFLIFEEPFSASFYRSMAVLVAASPCALAISTPSAVLSAIARAARGGVLIKGGRPLEDLGGINAIAFDKTGTLTEGKPKLTHSIPLEGISEENLVSILIAVESLSDHPLAKAMVSGLIKRNYNIELLPATKVKSLLGLGISADINADAILIGNLNLFKKLDGHKPGEEIKKAVASLESTGNTTMLVRKNSSYVGIVALMDRPRQSAGIALRKLKQIGIQKMVMLTGDNQKVADAVAKEIGLTEAWGGLLPEDKVKAIIELMCSENKVAMIGDGVNDAPAMANSTVGIAMGAAGSDVALETADIALMSDNLEKLAFAIGLGRKANRIIKQNLWISLGVVGILIPLTLFGIANLAIAVVIHEGSTLAVVVNGLRLLAYKED